MWKRNRKFTRRSLGEAKPRQTRNPMAIQYPKSYSIVVICCKLEVTYHIDFLPCYTCSVPCAVPTGMRDAHIFLSQSGTDRTVERFLDQFEVGTLGRNLARVLRTWFTDIRRDLVLKKQFMIPYTGAATKHEEQGDSSGSGQI